MALFPLNTNTRYLYDSLPEYSDKLLARFPDKLCKIFYVNSGSAATDLAIRMAETYRKREHHLVLAHGYHGNTRTGIDISSYKFDGKGGQGEPTCVSTLPLPNLFRGRLKTGQEYAEDAIKRMELLLKQGYTPASFIAEPVSGCGGQVPLAPGYLKLVNTFLKKQEILTIVDEVQTGFGRLGSHFWGFETHDIVPDLVLLGKPMGNGLPIAAVVTTEEIADSFATGMEFFSSFGGNPVSLAAASAVLDVMDDEGLQEHTRITGDYFKDLLNKIAVDCPVIGDIRGSGLFLGIEFIKEDFSPNSELAGLIKNQLKDRFILTGTDGPDDNVLKIKPPMCFTEENVDQFCKVLFTVLKENG